MMKTEYTRTIARQRRIRLIRFLPEKLLLVIAVVVVVMVVDVVVVVVFWPI